MGKSTINDVHNDVNGVSWNEQVNESAIVSHYGINPLVSGLLNGYRFAVKDVFQLAGYRNRAGNPDWYISHGEATTHAASVQQLLGQGAELVATTHTDELMYSLNGENDHYGTPINPAAPGRIPGGSSSGSSTLVASGYVDFALGTDTGGSVRVPAAYCGIYGFRPTHGAVDISGVIPLATSFDTVGWFARKPDVLEKVGKVLLQGGNSSSPEFSQVLYCKEAWELTSEEAYQPLLNAAQKVTATSGLLTEWVSISDNGLEEWKEAFRVIQGKEIWAAHHEWIFEQKPSFGPGIKERFQWTSTLTDEIATEKRAVREGIKHKLEQLLADHSLLVIPTTPDIAPLLRESGEALELRRQQTLMLTCIAGLSGLPQITIPAGLLHGAPIAISIIAGANQDLKLLSFVNKLLAEM